VGLPLILQDKRTNVKDCVKKKCC